MGSWVRTPAGSLITRASRSDTPRGPCYFYWAARQAAIGWWRSAVLGWLHATRGRASARKAFGDEVGELGLHATRGCGSARLTGGALQCLAGYTLRLELAKQPLGIAGGGEASRRARARGSRRGWRRRYGRVRWSATPCPARPRRCSSTSPRPRAYGYRR